MNIGETSCTKGHLFFKKSFKIDIREYRRSPHGKLLTVPSFWLLTIFDQIQFSSHAAMAE